MNILKRVAIYIHWIALHEDDPDTPVPFADMFKYFFNCWENIKYSGQAYCIFWVGITCKQGPC